MELLNNQCDRYPGHSASGAIHSMNTPIPIAVDIRKCFGTSSITLRLKNSRAATSTTIQNSAFHGCAMPSGFSTASSTMNSANGATHGTAARTGMNDGAKWAIGEARI